MFLCQLDITLHVWHHRLQYIVWSSEAGFRSRQLCTGLVMLVFDQQYVNVRSSPSTLVTCLSGVPQGSTHDPLLSAMYIFPVNNVAFIFTSMLTTRSCMSPYVLPTFHCLMLCCIALVTFHAGSWRTRCCLTRWKQFCFGDSRTADKIWHVCWDRTRCSQSCFQSNSEATWRYTQRQYVSWLRHGYQLGMQLSHKSFQTHPAALKTSVARMVAQGVVTSWLDHGNGLLYGTSTCNMERCGLHMIY